MGGTGGVIWVREFGAVEALGVESMVPERGTRKGKSEESFLEPEQF
jgi:hypothetical protein